jgi:hypothetical protein
MDNHTRQKGYEVRKYFTEIGLSLLTEGSAVFRPSVMQHLDKIGHITQSVLDDASIYFLCTKPRIRIEPDSIQRVSGDLRFDLVLDTKNGRQIEEKTVFGFFDFVGEVETVRVHDTLSFYIELIGKNGDESVNFPVEKFVPYSSFPGFNILDYEVLYIGQSQVGKSSGNIVSRLRNHSTLQAILADLHANAPHLEPFIFCFVLDPPRYVMHMDPLQPTETTDDEDMEHILHAYFNPPSGAQVTSIAEAAYIRFFRPAYNRLLKDSFPSTDLKLLQTCYDLDFSALAVEVNTEDLDARVYSGLQEPRYHHIASFDLHPAHKRKSFFELSLNRDGDSIDLRGNDDREMP